MAFKKEKDRIIDYIEKSNYKYKISLIEIYNKNKLELDNDILFDIIKIVVEENI